MSRRRRPGAACPTSLSRVRARAQVKALGHRVVHGKSISEPVLVDDAAMAAIQDAAELAPLCAPKGLVTPGATAGRFPLASACAAGMQQRRVCWPVMGGREATCVRSRHGYAPEVCGISRRTAGCPSAGTTLPT